MAGDLDERLARERARRREREWVIRRLAEARAERDRLTERVEALRPLVDSEHADVARLEAAGVGNLLRALFGTRASALKQEQAELAAVKLQLDEAADELRAAAADVGQLEARLSEVKDADESYARVVAEKEERLRGQGSPLAAGLLPLAEREGELRAALREIDEALAAGGAAEAEATGILGAFAEARSWNIGSTVGAGVADALGMGTLEVTAVGLVDQVKLAEVRQRLAATQQLLVRFQREARDVAGGPTLEGVEVHPMPGVIALIAEDLLVPGWSLLDTIEDGRWRADRTRDQIMEALAQLRARRAAVEGAIDAVRDHRAALIDPTPTRL